MAPDARLTFTPGNAGVASPSEEKEVSTTREQIQKVPVAMEQPGFRTLSPGTWGGMVVEYFECDQRIDFGPVSVSALGLYVEGRLPYPVLRPRGRSDSRKVTHTICPKGIPYGVTQVRQ